MKGVILAGGLGTRLHPLTRVTNKHLLLEAHLTRVEQLHAARQLAQAVAAKLAANPQGE